MSSSVVVFALVVFAFLHSGEAVRCWTCSSDLDPRCGDPFNATLPIGHHGYALTDCNAHSTSSSYPFVSSARSVCRKSKQLVKGDMTIIRSCVWQMPNTPIGTCADSPSSNQIQVQFCETCDTEGCNSAHSLAAMSLFAILALPVALLKVIC